MISGSYGGLLRHTTDNARIMAFKLPTGEVKIVYNTGFLRPFAAIQAIFTYKYFFFSFESEKGSPDLQAKLSQTSMGSLCP